jgi:hypothetical protein
MKKILVICAIILSSFFLAGCSKTQESELETKCNKQTPFKGSSEYNCCISCDKFGYEYLHGKYESGGIGREPVDNCFCKFENESKQIY